MYHYISYIIYQCFKDPKITSQYFNTHKRGWVFLHNYNFYYAQKQQFVNSRSNSDNRGCSKI